MTSSSSYDWLGRSFGGFVDQMEDCYEAKPSQAGSIGRRTGPLTSFGAVPPS